MTTETEPPALDADGFAICPDCGSCVNCGMIGLPNLEKRHCGTKVCKTAQQKRDKDAKKKKDGTKFNFLRPEAPIVPSTVHGPPPVHSYKLVPQSASNASPTAASTTSEQGKAVSDDPSLEADELWEASLNGVLKSTLGWGMEGNMDEIIRCGRWGLDGLVDFATYFVEERGVRCHITIFRHVPDYVS